MAEYEPQTYQIMTMIERDMNLQNTTETAINYTQCYPLCFINQVLCIDWQEGIKQVINESIDLVVTDPPYGMQFQSNHRNVKHKSIQNDDNLDWLGGWCKELKRVCKPEAHLYIFCSWHKVDEFKKQIGAYFNVKNILIWERTRFIPLIFKVIESLSI